jgi:hypothetical protein
MSYVTKRGRPKQLRAATARGPRGYMGPKGPHEGPRKGPPHLLLSWIRIGGHSLQFTTLSDCKKLTDSSWFQCMNTLKCTDRRRKSGSYTIFFRHFFNLRLVSKLPQKSNEEVFLRYLLTKIKCAINEKCNRCHGRCQAILWSAPVIQL